MSLTPEERVQRHARRAAEALEPEAGLLADADPIGLTDALTELGGALVRDPATIAAIGLRAAFGLAMTGATTALPPSDAWRDSGWAKRPPSNPLGPPTRRDAIGSTLRPARWLFGEPA